MRARIIDVTAIHVAAPAADDHASGVVVPWLVRLRWGALVALAVAGAAAT